jgi:nitrate/nitrite transporter NarK
MLPGSKDTRNYVTVKEGVSTPKYWHMYVMAYFSCFYGFYMASTYKNLGIDFGIDDLTLTIAGSVGSFFNGASRFGWGILADKYGFKLIYGALLVIQIIFSATVYFIV